MQSQVFRNLDMKAEMGGKMQQRRIFFFFYLFTTPRTNFSRLLFFVSSPRAAKKDLPLDQSLIRRLTEQACPLALTLYSLIPPPPSTPPFSLPPAEHTHTR